VLSALYLALLAVATLTMLAAALLYAAKETRRALREDPIVLVLGPQPSEPRVLLAVCSAAVGLAAGLLVAGASLVLVDLAVQALVIGAGAAGAVYVGSLRTRAAVDRIGPLVTLLPFAVGLLGGLTA